jgi:hypothetical protein
MLVWGGTTLAFSISWGNVDLFGNLFDDSGIDLDQYTDPINQVFTPLALFFLIIGIIFFSFGVFGILTLYCKKCLCTCLYGTCVSVFAFLTAIISTVLIVVVLFSNEFIDNYCAENWDGIPFGLGSSL